MSAYDLIIANMLLYVCVCAWVGVCLTEKKKEREMTGLWSADLFSIFFSAIRYLVLTKMLCVSVFFYLIEVPCYIKILNTVTLIQE